MRVAFDATSSAFEKKTGTGVYTEEIIRAYQKVFQEDQIYHTYRLTRSLKGKKYFLPLSNHSKRHTLLDPFTFWRGNQYDIFHGLNARLPILAHASLIVTIHDLFSVLGNYSAESFKRDQKQKYKEAIHRAHHVVAPSNFTKKQILEHFGVDSKKISVVGEGVREIFRRIFDKNKETEKIRNKFKIIKPFFLFVGTLEKRKNILSILNAFNEFNKNSPNTHHLVLIGNPGYGYTEILNRIDELNLKNHIVQLGFLDEEDIATFYRCCEAFVFLSLEEGYGIPIIESMACGAVVISSNTTSLPEVAHGHSCLIDPLDVKGAAQLMEAASSKKLVSQAVEGQKYALTLTWEKVAQELRGLYKEVMSYSRNP